jgi:hypothetical protein
VKTELSSKSIKHSKTVAAIPDAELGRWLRRSRAFKSGRPPNKARHHQRWSASEERLLLRLPDPTAAGMLGRSLRSVQRRRRSIGFKRHLIRRWTVREDRLLMQAGPKASTRELAGKMGRSFLGVQARRRRVFGARFKRQPWTRQETQMLGTRKDSEVAALLGRTEAAVTARRLSMGISALTPHRAWSPKENLFLGRCQMMSSPTGLAELYGL